MKQAIAGVAPAELEEVTVMVVWPSVSATRPGRLLGRLYAIRWPNAYIFRLGNLLAVLSIPLAVALYFFRLVPSVFGLPVHGRFYKLTNRRVVELRNEIRLRWQFPFLKFTYGAETKSVELDRFDTIEIVRQPGQHWFHAGDLVFKLGQVETFRLAGVSRPEAFRSTCLHSHRSYAGVKRARKQAAS
jgi:hypothetical protein